MRKIYEKYLKLLEKSGVTTYRVCKATDIPESTISMWKSRGGSLNITNLAKIAKYFEVPIEYFLSDEVME